MLPGVPSALAPGLLRALLQPAPRAPGSCNTASSPTPGLLPVAVLAALVQRPAACSAQSMPFDSGQPGAGTDGRRRGAASCSVGCLFQVLLIHHLWSQSLAVCPILHRNGMCGCSVGGAHPGARLDRCNQKREPFRATIHSTDILHPPARTTQIHSRNGGCSASHPAAQEHGASEPHFQDMADILLCGHPVWTSCVDILLPYGMRSQPVHVLVFLGGACSSGTAAGGRAQGSKARRAGPHAALPPCRGGRPEDVCGPALRPGAGRRQAPQRRRASRCGGKLSGVLPQQGALCTAPRAGIAPAPFPTRRPPAALLRRRRLRARLQPGGSWSRAWTTGPT